MYIFLWTKKNQTVLKKTFLKTEILQILKKTSLCSSVPLNDPKEHTYQKENQSNFIKEKMNRHDTNFNEIGTIDPCCQDNENMVWFLFYAFKTIQLDLLTP